jgi:hypothetical protein
VQARIEFIQIEVVALEEFGFLLLEESRCPFVNQVGYNKFAPVNQPSAYAHGNLFGNGTFAHDYKPLDPDAWPKSRNGKKIHRLNTFKLSIMQENKWEVG